MQLYGHKIQNMFKMKLKIKIKIKIKIKKFF